VSTRPTIALHILTLLAAEPDRALTSEYIAGSVNTNPVVIRRLLALLKRKRLVTSQPGTRGGWQLAVTPESITLLDVRRAVNEASAFALHSQEPNPACPVGRHIQGALEGVYAEAMTALERRLEQTTVAMLLDAVRKGRPRSA